MDTFDKAVALASIGLYVFPVSPNSKIPLLKSPGNNEGGLNQATLDRELIEEWFSVKHPEALLGVNAGRSGLALMDIDHHGENDGHASLRFAHLEPTPTFAYPTSRGGEHLIYTAPVPLKSAAPYRLESGAKLFGVDRKAIGGYFIWRGDTVPDSRAAFAPVPAWFAHDPWTEKPKGEGYSGTVEEWLALHSQKPDKEMRRLIRREIPTDDFDRDTLLRLQTRIVGRGADGWEGAAKALKLLRAEWLRDPFDTPKNRETFAVGLEGAIAKEGGGPTLIAAPKKPRTLVDPPASDETDDEPLDTSSIPTLDDEDDTFEADVTERVHNLKVDTEARRRVAAANYTGTEILTWQDLEAREVKWIVEDLVAEGSLSYLVARANTGKTFAFIDMVCRIATGKTWLGKATFPAKTLIVLGEGSHGAIDRFRAWCAFNGVELDAIKEHIKFVGGANLNNDESLLKLQEQAVDCQLIIVDTYAVTSGIEKEDDAALASITLNRARSINDSAALMFTHHPRKMDEDTDHPVMRGSGAMAGAADLVMTLFRDNGYTAENVSGEKWLALSTEAEHAGKNRNAQTETFRGLYLKEALDSAVFTQTDAAELSKADVKVKTHLTGSMTVNQFCDASKLSRPTALKYLKESRFADVEKGAGTTPDFYHRTDHHEPLAFKRPVKVEPDEETA
jgi:hypothetical protein